ncbi:proton channel OtopLc-like [Tachypleus tridentatus]|uniref:proton channel OtopLc-like n=1 Tax=Tachypleus tridentatus TaxID=6853 RepID=UPI003FD4DBD0
MKKGLQIFNLGASFRRLQQRKETSQYIYGEAIKPSEPHVRPSCVHHVKKNRDHHKKEPPSVPHLCYSHSNETPPNDSRDINKSLAHASAEVSSSQANEITHPTVEERQRKTMRPLPPLPKRPHATSTNNGVVSPEPSYGDKVPPVSTAFEGHVRSPHKEEPVESIVKYNEQDEDKRQTETDGKSYEDLPKNQQFVILSSIYAQLLIVICIALFTTEVVTSEVSLFYFEGFYLYLYAGSLTFLLYINVYPIHNKETSLTTSENVVRSSIMNSLRKFGHRGKTEDTKNHRSHKTYNPYNVKNHGSFFLRIGAIAFGIGTMIYNGMEFGKFFEIPVTSPCYSILLGVNPVFQMIFTFFQMYFIFVNTKLNIQRLKVVARFGLMHMVATNICIWLRTLGKETLYEISTKLMKNGKTNLMEELLVPARDNNTRINETNICQKTDIIDDIVSQASPFLYPFTVEFSLIGSAVLYVMWKNIGKNPAFIVEKKNNVIFDAPSVRNSARMNCIGASKGLFLGLLVLVICMCCLIAFFVLVHHEEHKILAIYLGDISHCALLVLNIISVIVGFIRIRTLKYLPDRKEQVSSILLTITGFGLYLYAVFGIIAGSLSSIYFVPNVLVLIISGLTLFQAIIQSLFISDVVCRSTYLPEHDKQKPGRHVVTFLIINNVTLWIIYTLQMQKMEASPVEFNFFGMWGWTLVVHMTLPLAIFYRFHSAVTFADVWKNSYRNIYS